MTTNPIEYAFSGGQIEEPKRKFWISYLANKKMMLSLPLSYILGKQLTN